MKTITQTIATFFVATFMSLTSIGQDIDLVQGLNYAYDPIDAQGVLSIDYIDICNNGSDAADPFDVTVYLYDESTQDTYFIGTERLSNGLSGNTCVSIENWDINVNNTSGIPAGTYRVGVWVDSDEEISETDEDNNTGLMTGDNTYDPSTSNLEELDKTADFTIYPNPASEFIHLKPVSTANITSSVSIVDLNGRVVQTLNTQEIAKDQATTLNLSTLDKGVYMLRFATNKGRYSEKIIIE
ncbi:MAG: T9SS type A sorting domain-containing protein [Bacteroidota bacterium]